jgi:hypothetical protein
MSLNTGGLSGENSHRLGGIVEIHQDGSCSEMYLGLSEATYADLKRSGLIPPAVLDFIRTRCFDGPSVLPSTIDEAKPGTVFLRREAGGRFSVEICFQPTMTEDDFQAIMHAYNERRTNP